MGRSGRSEWEEGEGGVSGRSEWEEERRREEE